MGLIQKVSDFAQNKADDFVQEAEKEQGQRPVAAKDCDRLNFYYVDCDRLPIA